MNMNKTFMLRKEDRKPEWHVIDASGLVLGRLATRVADVLRGKNRPEFTPHEDAGDYVVIINCEKIMLTGDKVNQKIYTAFSGYRGGLKKLTARQVFDRDPAMVIEKAVKGMLPKNKLSDRIIKKLKVYKGSEHPHQAQI